MTMKKRLTFKRKLAILGFILYVTFILLSRVPLLAESGMRQSVMDNKYDYNLVFTHDGETTHYIVERTNTALDGKIDLTYTTLTHTLNVATTNIKNLTIDCNSVYEDESNKVFKRSPTLDANYYKSYFINEKGLFTVIVQSDHEIELRFKYAPRPTSVLVNNIEWWKTTTNYTTQGDYVIVKNVPSGTTTVLLLFKEQLSPTAMFEILDTNTYKQGNQVFGYVDTDITFDASASHDDDDQGTITGYSWDFGDDSALGSGQIATHKYSSAGNYEISLTVTDNDGLTNTYSLSITITIPSNDADNDGMDDTWELANGLDPLVDDANLDADGDELSNLNEFLQQTDPQNRDSDDDQLPDGWEVEWKLDPNNGQGDNGSGGDPDDDGHDNMDEFNHKTDPLDEDSYHKAPEDEKEEDSIFMVIGILIVVIIIIILIISYLMFYSRGGGLPRGPGIPPVGDRESREREREREDILADEEGAAREYDEEKEYDEDYEEEFIPDGDDEFKLEGDDYEYGYGEETSEEFAPEPEADVLGVETELPTEVEGEVVEAIKPEVRTIATEDRMEIIELGLVHPCYICQATMPFGEKAFQCTCGLISHQSCLGGMENCPQCGAELDPALLPKPPKPSKKKKPMIRKEITREVVERTPPKKAYFTFVPKKSSDSEISEFMSEFLENKNVPDVPGSKINKDEVGLFIALDCAQDMMEHCYVDGRKKEVMGLMIGETFQHKGEVISVVKDVVSSDLDATEVNVKFDSFEKLFDQLDQLTYEYQIIGWYHSHPDYSSFMSPTDADTQERMFKHPYQYALVIDPIRFDMNAFIFDPSKKRNVRERSYAIIDRKDIT